MNILIADDEEELTEIIDYLVRHKFADKIKTFVAKSGKEAIAILKNHTIDVCISDHNMPEGKGHDVLKYIMDSKLVTSFVLCSTVIPKDMPDVYPPKHVFFHIQKPQIVEGVTALHAFIRAQEAL